MGYVTSMYRKRETLLSAPSYYASSLLHASSINSIDVMVASRLPRVDRHRSGIRPNSSGVTRSPARTRASPHFLGCINFEPESSLEYGVPGIVRVENN